MRNLKSQKLKIVFLLGFFLTCLTTLQAQVTQSFSLRNDLQIKGDITMIGNNIVNRKKDSYTYSTGPWWNQTTVTVPTKVPNDPYPGSDEPANTANDSFEMRYIDIDGDPSTFSSSKATLAIPDLTCSKVVYAALYWSATYRYNNNDGTGGRDAINQVKFKLPGASAYSAVTGTVIYDGFTDTVNTALNANSPYACYADVTALLQGLADPNGDYTVADIRVTQSGSAQNSNANGFAGGASGGWNLFVIYENPTLPGKYIASFDGFAGVNSSLTSGVDVSYSGFTTVPAPLTVKAKLASAALEGDLQITGDQLQFQSGANPFAQLSNTLNPATNFFNANVTNMDAAGNPVNVTARTPNSTNTLGYDSDIISIPTGYIPNGATSATLKMISTQDTYYMFFNALAVDMIEPEITLVKTVENAAGQDIGGQDVTLGDQLNYVLTFDNVGNDHAIDFTIGDKLPVNTFLQTIDMTDVPGGTYSVVNDSIVFTIPNNLVLKGLESVPHKIKITVKVAETCNELTDQCADRIQNQAFTLYRGFENSAWVSAQSVTGIGSCGGPVVGPANFLVDVDDCIYTRNEILCGPPITLTAGDGYVGYQWFREDGATDIPLGTTQSIQVSAPGEYYVMNDAAPPCVDITEHIFVDLNTALVQSNPVAVAGIADTWGPCANDGRVMANIFLCGINDSRFIPSGVSTGTVSWQKYNPGPGCDTVEPVNCPHNAIPCEPSWQDVATGPNYTADTAGEYRMKIDAGGCYVHYYFNVYKNNLDPQVEVQNIVCTTPGEIKVINVPAGYEYTLINQTTNATLVPYGSASIFPIATVGVYKIILKQVGVSNGCEFVIENIGVMQKTMTVNITPTDKTCSTPGSINIQALGVDPQYTFTITGPGGVNITHGPVVSNNHNFTGLNPGTYTVTTTTEDGCTNTSTVTVQDASQLDLIATVSQHISCSQGNIQMNGSNGKTPYSYAIYSYNGVLQNPTLGDYQSSVIFDIEIGEQGDYIFIMKDSNGCTTLSNLVTINLIPDVVFTSTVQNVLCYGQSNGSITLNITNANGYNVSFDLLNSSGTVIATNTSGTFTGLAPGDYTVVLHQTKGNKSCDFEFPYTITQPTAITAASQPTLTQAYTCTTTGTITIDPTGITGGTAPYTYSINGTTFGTATTFTGLTAGTYTVLVKDASGCVLNTIPVTIPALTPPTNLDFSATPVLCSAPTSTVTLTTTGGSGALTYQITAPSAVNNGTSNVFAGLAPGTYTFVVTDAKGCTYPENYTINSITPISVVGVKVNDVRCFNAANGALTYTVSGFGANYNYSVASTGTAIAPVTGATSGTITLTNLLPGDYTITVTSPATNCQDTATVTILNPTAALAVTTNVVQPTCPTPTGSLTVMASDGWGGYSYALSGTAAVGPQASPSFTGLAAGPYTLTVTDANGCIFTDTFTITAPVVPELAITASDLCVNANGTSITVAVNAGTGTAPFQYSLDGGAYQNGATFTGLAVGGHTVTVRDANGCTDTTPTQTVNPQLTATVALDKGLDCTASPDAQITVTIAGGLAPYNYEVKVGVAAFTAPVAVGGTVLNYSAAASGTYQFRITDAAGCILTTGTTTIIPITPPQFTFGTITNVLCNGAATGAIQVNITPGFGAPPYVIAVTNTTTSTPYGTQTSALPAGNYSVTVTDANGCTATDTALIDEPDPMVFDIQSFSLECTGSGIVPGRIIIGDLGTGIGVTGGTAPYTYNVSNNFGVILPPYQTTYNATPAQGEAYEFVIVNYGIYTVEIVDANGCTVSEQNIIIASPPETLDITTNGTSDCTTGGSMVVEVGTPVPGAFDYQFGILTQNVAPYVANAATDFIGPDTPGGQIATFNNLLPGVIYTFVVYDPNTQCYYFEQSTVPVLTNSTISTTTLTPHNVTCNGEEDGNVSFTFTGYSATTTQVKYEIYKSPSNISTGITATIPTTGTSTTVATLLLPMGDPGLAPGDYIIVYTEIDGSVAGCSQASASFKISQSASMLSVSAVVTENDNCNPAAGIITATAQFGTPPYEYQLVLDTDPADPAVPAEPTVAAWAGSADSVLEADGGDYVVYVKDANNCIKGFDIVLPTDISPEITAVMTPGTQCTTAEGDFTIDVTRTVNGSVGPFLYSLDGGAFQAQADPAFTYTGLTSGIHTIDVQDVNGCPAAATTSVTVYPPVTVTAQPTLQPTCPLNVGEITATGLGGSGNFEYELQTAAGAPVAAQQPSAVFAGQVAGNYKVIIYDMTTLCTAEAFVTLDATVAVTFTTTKDDVNCNGNNDGSITIILPASNTDIPYTYTIDGTIGAPVSQSTPVFTGLVADTYDVTVTSGKGCFDTVQVIITEPSTLDSTASVTTAFACAPDNTVNTATVTVTEVAGTGTAPYTYSIDGTNYFTTNTFAVANTGAVQTINTYVKDSNGCFNTFPLTIDPLPAMGTPTAMLTTAIECDDNTGVITVAITGGSGDFTFEMLPSGPSFNTAAAVTSQVFTITEPGVYTFKVTDDVTGCSTTVSAAEVVEYDIIAVAATASTPVTCFGDANGTIEINVTGYSGAYSYEVFDGATSITTGTADTTINNPFTVPNVSAGNLFVRITATGTPFCSADTTIITVGSPADPLLSNAAATANVTCTNDMGEIVAQATGGWGGYEYELVNTTTSTTIQVYAANNIFTGLAEGNYTVFVRDSGNCISSQNVTLTRPPFITASISASATLLQCNGDTTATVTATGVTGGQGTYQYVLNTYDATGTTIVNSTGGQIDPVFAGLGAGIYSITVTDGWGCDLPATATVTITEPAPLVGYLSLTKSLTCTTLAEITISATGGTAPYTYSTDDVTYTGTTVYPVDSGTYTYYVKDANGCTAVQTNSVEIPAVPALDLNLDLDAAEISCAGGSNAEITSDATGGLGNYQYTLLNTGTGATTGPNTTGNFPNLSAGTYQVTVDSGDCTLTSSIITITDPPVLISTPVVTNILCFGEATGSIAFTTTGGTGIVQYAISPNLAQFVDDNVFDGLPAGTYTIIVQDQSGCFLLFNETITEPTQVQADITIHTDEACLGSSDGTIDVEIWGGTEIYEISTDDVNYVPVVGFTHTLTGLPAGMTTVYVKDSNGCSLNPPMDQPILAGVDMNPQASVVTTCVANAPNNNVTISVTPTANATGTIDYSIDNTTWQLSNVFNNVSLGAGTYTAYARHTMPVSGLECIQTTPFTIAPHTAIAATANITQTIDCFGDLGEITIDVTAGAGTAPFEYAIGPGFVFGTPNVFSGLTASTYDFKVRDAIGCEFDITGVVLGQPTAALTATATHTDEICLGENNGSITVTPTGGTAPYEARINGEAYTATFTTSFTFNALAPGTYTVDVRDANGCTYTITPDIIIAPGVELLIDPQVYPNCTNNVIGNVVFISANPNIISDLQFSVDGDPFRTSNDYYNLAPGTHTATVQHANGCTDTVPFTVPTLLPISASVDATTNVNCFGDATGAITVTATGGTGTLSYAIADADVLPLTFGTYQATGVFTGLTAGNYAVSIMDDNLGCEMQVTTTINEPTAALTATAGPQTNVLCYGASTGSATIVVTGGTGAYSYSWNTTPVQTTATATGLVAGTYTVTVTDANLCTTTQAFTITQPAAPLTATAGSQTNVLCYGNATGAATVNVAGGTAAYSYSWNTTLVQTTATATGLVAGTYTVTVTDANGCTTTQVFTITEPAAALTATAGTQTNVLCFGASTGAATVDVTGGTAAYSYSWNTAPVQTTATATGLVAGTYTVTVTDANGCTTTQVFTITEPAAPLAATAGPQTNVLCYGNTTGAATVNVTGGTGAYSYSWNTTPVQTTATATGLVAGTYTVTVTDSNGCTTTQAFTITQPAAPLSASAGTTQTNVLCFGGATGSATIVVTGGTTAYSYSWNTTPVQTTATATGLVAGTYTVTVTDANGCTTTQAFTITEPAAALTATAGTQTNVLCFGGATGSATIVVTGGTTAYSYSWNTTPVQTTATATGLVAGTYTVTVTDANGCTTTQAFTITEPAAALTATAGTQTNVLCFGASTGAATVDVTGGTAAYSYSWNTTPVQTTATATGLVAGTYTVTVTDANGCTTTQVFTITEPAAPLAATAGPQTNVLCYGNTTGAATVNVTGGTGAYSYSWNTTPVQTTATATGLVAGTYTVTVTDSNGCTTTQAFTITQPAAPLSASAGTTQTNVLCFGGATGSATIVVTGGTTAYSYSWNTTPVQTTATATGLIAGTYTVMVTDANGCNISQPFTITQPATALTATAGTQTNVLCFGASTGSATIVATGGTGVYSYSWNTTPVQTTATATGLTAGNYQATVTDANGCSAIATFTISQPAMGLSATIAHTDESCINYSNGSITITPSGGIAPYEVRINGGAYSAPSTAPVNFTALMPGNYTVEVRDANGCIYTPPSVTIIPGVDLQVSVSTTQECQEVTVVVSVNPAVEGQVTYSLDGGTPQTSNTFDDVVLDPAIPHNVTVLHIQGCSDTQPVPVMATIPITATLSVTNIACHGKDVGSITVNATGGTGPLQYAITWGIWPTPIYGSSNTFTALLANTDEGYTIWVKDAMGCAVPFGPAYITEPAEELIINAVVGQHESCINAQDGSIDITLVQGGTPPYYVALDSPNNFQPYEQAATPDFANLYGRTLPYEIYVRDANGCYAKAIVTIEKGVNLVPGIATVLSCVNNVPVNTVTATLNTIVNNVEYRLETAAGVLIQDFAANNTWELAPGDYTYTVRHINGCQKDFDFTVQPRVPITVTSVIPTDTACNGSTDGTLTVTATGGSGTLQYGISPDYEMSSNPVFTGLAPGSYTIRVQDQYGCYIDFSNFPPIGEPALIIVTDALLLQEICVDDNNAAIEIEIQGGIAPYATSLDADGPFVTDQTLFDNLDGGATYTIFVQDANGCIATHDVTLDAPMDIDAKAEVVYNCDQNTVTIVTDSSVNPGELTYAITAGPNGNNPPQTENEFSNLEDGDYTVEVVNTVTGCTDETQFNITSVPDLALSLSMSGLNEFQATVAGGQAPYQYTLNGESTGTDNTFVYYKSGLYEVTVTDSRGCTKVATIEVVFIDVILPDVVTPDGNGNNDTWSPGNTANYPNINSDIFDRYGRKLATLRQGQAWDGMYEGNPMPTGDYWYLVKLGDADDRSFVGHFTIYR